MRRAAVVAALVAASSPAFGQSTTCGINQACGSIPAWSGSARDGAVEQAVDNTVCYTLLGYELSCTDSQGVATLVGINNMIGQVAQYGIQAPNGPYVDPSNWTWAQVLRGISWKMPYPYPLGEERGGVGFFGAGGSFGGAGAGGSWTCNELDLEIAPDGSLIIPSYPLRMGGPIAYGQYFSNQSNSAPGHLGNNTIGDHHESRMRRVMHLWNMTLPKADWWGIVGPTGPSTYEFATVAYRTGNGSIVNRLTQTVGHGNWVGPHAQDDSTNNMHIPHQPCPVAPVGGAHYYAYTDWTGSHLHNCVEYIPNTTLAPDGYAINPHTSIPWPAAGWPNGAPQHLKDCPLSKRTLAKLAEKLWEHAAEQPGYAGHPRKPITEDNARPGDTRVGDLGDHPVNGADPGPNEGTAVPPEPSTNPNTPTQTINVTVDFGPDPGTGAPTLDEPPTGIMDPIFEWLPDLPSLSLESQASACPTWAVNLTEFGGPEWVWLLDSHCPIFEENRSLIGGLMLALFGIGAALIILRA